MPGLSIHTSNRQELLAQRLAQALKKPLTSVFAQEVILTQSPGMSRWVAMELAKRHRISANTIFPFPNTFLMLMRDALSLEALPEDPFDPVILTFRIMKKLPSCLTRPGYEALQTYFAGDRRQIKLLQLSQKIAHLFDQYMVFRPDIISDWDKGKQTADSDTIWQADLWREVASGREHLHRVSMHAAIMEKIDRSASVADDLPERISVFGISYLPVFHLQILAALSRVIPVNCFLMSPCRQYWGEVVSNRDIGRIREKYAYMATDDIDLHLDKGNPLLSSFGSLGRDFLALIGELDCEMQEDYRPPGRYNLLGTIQADILDMLDATENKHEFLQKSADGSASFKFDSDNSIEVHSCHSIMREVEVLHDHILEMFQQDRDLQPREILVMTPDLDTYAPFIQAVFGREVEGRNAIPFSLADRSVMEMGRLMEGFFSLLGLAGSRMEADSVTGLLEYPMIRRRFRLSRHDVSAIEQWTKDLNIRWGLDGYSRGEMGLPSFEENTWKSGIDRLLLGYAMSVQGKKLYAHMLPYDDMEGDHARILGNFMDYFTCLLDTIRDLKAPKTLQGWSASFLSILDRMFLTDASSEKELQLLKRLLGRMTKIEPVSEFSDTLELDVVVYHLKGGLQQASFGAGFMAGGVTICAMLPMRSIPFTVICLLGMNGNDFPRVGAPLGFDLMAAHPRIGDRSKRNDDKYLFLEALLSARKKLYISYIGRDIQDNSDIAPSVLVSELIDYIRDGYSVPQDKIIRSHPLQAFSSEYFTATPDLFSYSAENLAAARAASGGTQNSRQVAYLPESQAQSKKIGVDTLGKFFVNPVKYFMQNRLGIFLEEGDGLTEEGENFRLAGLENYKVGLESLKFGATGNDIEALLPVFKARGVLPPGRVGEHDFAEISIEAKELIARMDAWISGTPPQDLAINLHLHDFSICGSLPDLYGNRIVRVRYVKLNARDLIRLWTEHLQLCTAGACSDRPQSVYLCRNETVVFEPVDNCRDVLAYLLRQFWKGLSRPLNFFPQSAYAYAQKRVLQQATQQQALQAATSVMQGGGFKRGEIEEPYTQFYFDDENPLDENFESMAIKIFEPLFGHHKRLSV